MIRKLFIVYMAFICGTAHAVNCTFSKKGGIVFSGDCTVKGNVRGPYLPSCEQYPIPNMNIVVRATPRDADSGQKESSFSARTDKDGNFEIKIVNQKHAKYALEFKYDGLATKVVDLDTITKNNLQVMMTKTNPNECKEEEPIAATSSVSSTPSNITTKKTKVNDTDKTDDNANKNTQPPKSQALWDDLDALKNALVKKLNEFDKK